ncbi:MAG: GNAT family N-acetyltransferase [Gammaproteobacteria bacterium]
MSSAYLSINPFSHVATIGHAPEKPGMYVRELTEGDRHCLLMHFLALDASARLFRFGMVFPDELITAYVQQMNFARDTLFGVYDGALMLAGVGHLAFMPREALPVVARVTSKERVAEFGVSVSASARGIGIGTRLFDRAAIHCRNADVDTLYMQFLSSNQSMMHIAERAGMEVHHDHGEADAYLKLPPADAASASQEVAEEQVASLDYTVKLKARLLRLTEAEARHRALVETTPAITYMADLTDKVKMHYVSPQTENLLGFSVQEWLTDPERWVKQLHPQDRDRVLDAFNDTFLSGMPFKMDYRLVTRDGTSRWFQEHGVVITDPLQKRRFMYGTMVDITDRKAAEA